MSKFLLCACAALALAALVFIILFAAMRKARNKWRALSKESDARAEAWRGAAEKSRAEMEAKDDERKKADAKRASLDGARGRDLFDNSMAVMRGDSQGEP